MARQLAKRDEGLFVTGKIQWCKQRTQPLEVMCLGVCRTGTTSMLEAMAILGYGTMYNAREAVRRQQLPFAGYLLENKYHGRPPTIEQLESCWGEYRTISGDTVYPFAEECINYYPDAKIVLTVRDDEEKWLHSLGQTIWYNRNRWLSHILPLFDTVHANISLFTGPFWKYLLLDDVPNQGIRWYREHNAMVRRLGGERCLVFSAKEGWEPLCKFLGKEVPDVPFPHVNKMDEHRFVFRQARMEGLMKLVRRAVVGGGFAGAVIGVVWWQRLRIGSFLGG